MAIHPTCDMCQNELQTYGAIVLSPPNSDGTVMKYHVCASCYKQLSAKLQPPHYPESTEETA